MKEISCMLILNFQHMEQTIIFRVSIFLQKKSQVINAPIKGVLLN
jgi:hypothetical protein